MYNFSVLYHVLLLQAAAEVGRVSQETMDTEVHYTCIIVRLKNCLKEIAFRRLNILVGSALSMMITSYPCLSSIEHADNSILRL